MILETELLEIVSEPSRAFFLKAQAKTEPSLGSGASLLTTFFWKEFKFESTTDFSMKNTFTFGFNKKFFVKHYKSDLQHVIGKKLQDSLMAMQI